MRSYTCGWGLITVTVISGTYTWSRQFRMGHNKDGIKWYLDSDTGHPWAINVL